MVSYNLLGEKIRVQNPYVKVSIGNYSFGVFQQSSKIGRDEWGNAYKIQNIQYPNYIQSLSVKKINGQVNTYTLNITYAITQDNDPNFFEKVFSSVSQTRKIVFSYGDLNAPAFLYRNEEAIITQVNEQVSLSNASIQYTVTAVSSSSLSTVGAFNFPSYNDEQPSFLIKEIVKNNSKYGLLDIFTGMRNWDKVLSSGLIASDDRSVNIQAKRNISVLDYLTYLVSCMQSSINNKDIYVFKVIDDTTGDWGGPYFKITNSTSSANTLDSYELDIGFDYKTNSAITSFQIDNNEQYSIFYDYTKKLETSEYIQKIQDDGTMKEYYAPLASSNNDQGITQPNDYNWWKNVTQYPISATIQLRGLLRPAILMNKLRLNVYFYGHKYIASGDYLITQQQDDIGTNGFYTTLKLTKVAGSDMD